MNWKSLFSFFKKEKTPKKEITPVYKKETKRTLSEKELQLKSEILEILQSNQKLTVKWDCGGDEGFIHTFLDGVEIEYGNDFSGELEMYLLNYLELPSVGEFELEGGGELTEENGVIYINYESTIEFYEEVEDVTDLDDMFSGKARLFKI